MPVISINVWYSAATCWSDPSSPFFPRAEPANRQPVDDSAMILEKKWRRTNQRAADTPVSLLTCFWMYVFPMDSGSSRRGGLHDAIAVPAGLLLLLQRLDVDVKFFDFLPDGSNSSSRHVFSQLRTDKKHISFTFSHQQVKAESVWVLPGQRLSLHHLYFSTEPNRAMLVPDVWWKQVFIIQHVSASSYTLKLSLPFIIDIQFQITSCYFFLHLYRPLPLSTAHRATSSPRLTLKGWLFFTFSTSHVQISVYDGFSRWCSERHMAGFCPQASNLTRPPSCWVSLLFHHQLKTF